VLRKQNLFNDSFPSYGFPNRQFHNQGTVNTINLVKCYRCGKLGHYIKQCRSEKARIKSPKKIHRDNERLRLILQKKCCENLPFSSLDDSEFRKTVKLNSFKIQINSLQFNNKSLIQEKVKLEDVIGTVKENMKETKKSLNGKIDNLKEENKYLKTKLQKTIGQIRIPKEDVDFLVQEHNKMLDTIHKLYREIDNFRREEQKYKKEISEWTVRCKELEDIKINNVIRDMCSCSDQMQPYAKPVNYSTKSCHGNNRRSRGRDRN